MLLPLFSHQDRYYLFEVDNIIVRVKTGFQYEEIDKAEILARMLRDLTNEIGYCKNIQVDFIHDYTYNYKKCISFINFGKPKIVQRYSDRFLSKSINNSKLIIRNLNTHIDFRHICKVVSIGCQNIKFIKRNQAQYEFDDGYNGWTIYSISQNQLSELISNDTSEYVNRILDNVYVKDSSIEEGSINYFIRNNTFHFFNSQLGMDSILYSTQALFQNTFVDDVLVVAETPCKIVLLGEKITHLEKFDRCDGVWELLKYKECTNGFLTVNYMTNDMDILDYYLRAVDVFYSKYTGERFMEVDGKCPDELIENN